MPERHFTIDGPAGVLEARLTEPDGHGITSLAILCHPHPLYGGSLDDGVLSVLAEVLVAAGCGVLRFNFRGVGGSGGQHDGNGGEAGDLNAVLDWARSNHPGARIVLGGYSFGASTVCRLLADADPANGSADIERVLLIAPPVGNLPVPPPDGRIQTDVFVGDADPYVDQSALQSWHNATVHILAGADHFFTGHWPSLRTLVADSYDS